MGMPKFISVVVFFFHFCSASKSWIAPRDQVKFLIASAPKFGKVSYLKIPSGIGRTPSNLTGSVTVLIDEGLVHPQGIAVDQRTRTLYVADPDSQAVFAYPLHANRGKLTVGPRRIAANGTEARWVSVDGTGTLFFSNEAKNQVLKVMQTSALRGNATPTVIYDGSSVAQVNAPGGIATDNFYTYWANKQIGTQIGSIVKGAVHPDISNLQASITPLSKNTDKSYGVCLALNNVYYTQPDKTIYGVKKGGSDVVAITDRLTNPRGCSWDGDGTIYVADRGANAIYSFAGNMEALGTATVTKTVAMDDAFGVAVFSAAARRQWSFHASEMLGMLVAVFLLQCLSL